ncbi:MAG: transcriptional regulator GcvA [Rhodocyclaceae bacterium]
MANLPPLKSLRVFESAARHLSFTRAAAELNVTQAAVSQQIRMLEAHLGLPLFRRLNRRLLLTDPGQAYALQVREALDILREATARVTLDAGGNDLTMSVTPSFAHKWLMPRLGRFSDRHPGIVLRLHTSFDVMPFGEGRAAVQCAVRQGRGPYPGLFAQALLDEEFFPVCAPALAQTLRTPAELSRVTVIRDEGVPWSDWLRAAGLPLSTIGKGPGFLDSSMALQAAIDGRGVTLGRTALVADDLAAGRLVEPFALRLHYDLKSWFVCPRGHETRSPVRELLDWLSTEAAALSAGGRRGEGSGEHQGAARQ